jgi:hypothetical protein
MDVVVMANTVHGYMSQSDKGEMVIGGGADGYNNYTQRGSFHHVEETVRALIETFPIISRLKMLRWWGGIVDMTGDRSPIISKTPVEGVFVNCGWGTGGFKAIPGSGWAMAELMAKGHSPLGRCLFARPVPRGAVHRRERGGRGGALTPAIPRRLAHIWVGERPPPLHWMQTWRDHHPIGSIALRQRLSDRQAVAEPASDRGIFPARAARRRGRSDALRDPVRNRWLHPRRGFRGVAPL